MSVESNRAAVRAYFDAVGRGDRAALIALFQPDLRWSVPKGAIAPYGGLHHGAEKIVGLMLAAVSTAFVPGTQRVEVGTAKRPSGAPDYDNNSVFAFELSGGKIAEIREHVGTRYAAQVFGA